MTSSSNPGRVAGFLYLLLGFSVFRPIYVERALIVRNSALATAHNIVTHESLFRLAVRGASADSQAEVFEDAQGVFVESAHGYRNLITGAGQDNRTLGRFRGPIQPSACKTCSMSESACSVS